MMVMKFISRNSLSMLCSSFHPSSMQTSYKSRQQCTESNTLEGEIPKASLYSTGNYWYFFLSLSLSNDFSLYLLSFGFYLTIFHQI